MSSDTTKALLQTVYDRLVAYTDSAGRKLTDYLSVSSPRLWVRLSADSVQYPYVVYRVGEAETDVEMMNLRAHFTIEARCVHRTEDGTVETIADLIEEALLTWVESSSSLGLTFGQSSRRESQEPLTDAPNRDLAEVTVYVTCVSWAKRLTGIIA